MAPDWRPTVEAFWQSPEGRKLSQFMQKRLLEGAVVYPSTPFRALELTPLNQVRVVILGQDPYHGPGQAHGLAFSVPVTAAPALQKLPPSLRNIFKELVRDPALPDFSQMPAHGLLEHWAHQGVLLLNTCLTVEDASPASHAKQGWEALTCSLLSKVLVRDQPVVFMLWGGHAQEAFARACAGVGLSTNSSQPSHPIHHLVLKANHPSPLSALRPPVPFIGCGHFSRANAHFASLGLPVIRW